MLKLLNQKNPLERNILCQFRIKPFTERNYYFLRNILEGKRTSKYMGQFVEFPEFIIKFNLSFN